MSLEQSVSQHYTQYANKKYHRSGKLWENRYKLHLVDPDRQWCLARYIEKNPLRARMVERAEHYPYSSARAHLLGKEDKILSHDILGALGNRYRKFFEEVSIEEETELRLREVIQQEKAFGGQEFLKKIQTIFGFDFELKERGRPKRNKLSTNK